MKKILSMLLTLTLIMLLMFTFSGCGSDEPVTVNDDPVPGTDSPNDAGDEGKIDVQDAVDQALKEAAEANAFSVEAVDYFLKTNIGLTSEDFQPDYEWMVKDYFAYGDKPDAYYGHAAITYTKAEGEITEDQYEEWAAAVFEKTASISQDGFNICGWDYIGDGDDPLAERTLETAMDSWMPGWCFRYNDKFWNVSIGMSYDNDLDSEIGNLLYYNGCELDVAAGLEKSFDDLWADLEQAFEENEDEIKEALEDFAD